MTPALEQIKALPAKWRDAASKWDNLHSGAEAAFRLRDCADELDTALQALHDEAGEAEPVAWMDAADLAEAAERGSFMACSHAYHGTQPNLRYNVPLYTRPAPAAEAAPDYPECSGNPADCPENEGHGCCKRNDGSAWPAAEAAPQGGVSPEVFRTLYRDMQAACENSNGDPFVMVDAVRLTGWVLALGKLAGQAAAPPSAPAEHEGDPQSCREADGCPTEGAVLRREWRAMKARIAALEAALAAGALPQGMVLVPRALAEMAVTVASEWLDLFADTPGLEKYDRFTYGPQVELLRDDLTAALAAAPAQGVR